MAKPTKNTTDTSRKGDFGPLKEGTREFNEAVVARKELLGTFGSSTGYNGTGSVSKSAVKIAKRKTANREMGKVPNYTPAKARTKRILEQTAAL